jgi:hypothetical protein
MEVHAVKHWAVGMLRLYLDPFCKKAEEYPLDADEVKASYAHQWLSSGMCLSHVLVIFFGPRYCQASYRLAAYVSAAWALHSKLPPGTAPSTCQ